MENLRIQNRKKISTNGVHSGTVVGITALFFTFYIMGHICLFQHFSHLSDADFQFLSTLLVCSWIFLFVLSLLIGVSIIQRLYIPFCRLRSALGHISDSNYLPKKSIEDLIDSSIEHHQSQLLRHLLVGQTTDHELPTQAPYLLVLFNRHDLTALREHLLPLAPNAIIGQKSSATLALFPQGNAGNMQSICRDVAQSLQCRCFCSDTFLDLSDIPNQYGTLLELHALRFWEPTPTLLSSHHFPPRNPHSSYSEKQANQILTALKNGDAPLPLWSEFLDTIRHDSYHNQFVAFSRLSSLLHHALDDGSVSLVTESSMAKLEDIQVLTAQFSSLFDRVAHHGMEQRRHRLRDLTLQVTSCVEAQYTDPHFSASDVATTLNMSSAYLGRLFREDMDMPISEFLNRTRIERASQLLLETQLPAEQIALSVGFGNTKYFFVVFKQYKGQTPLQYRRSHLSGTKNSCCT